MRAFLICNQARRPLRLPVSRAQPDVAVCDSAGCPPDLEVEGPRAAAPVAVVNDLHPARLRGARASARTRRGPRGGRRARTARPVVGDRIGSFGEPSAVEQEQHAGAEGERDAVAPARDRGKPENTAVEALDRPAISRSRGRASSRARRRGWDSARRRGTREPNTATARRRRRSVRLLASCPSIPRPRLSERARRTCSEKRRHASRIRIHGGRRTGRSVVSLRVGELLRRHGEAEPEPRARP